MHLFTVGVNHNTAPITIREHVAFQNDHLGDALRELTALVRRYEKQDQAYRSVVLTMWANRYGTYDDLARVKEWSAAGIGGGDE